MAALRSIQRLATWITAALGARSAFKAMVALVLCLSLSLSGCSGASGKLSGNYVNDTVSVAESLLTTIHLDAADPGRSEAEKEARALINDYTARYRPRQDINSLGSFTTMVTAVNSLASHYLGYANRPLPEALRDRIEKELHQAQAAVVRGT
ncbi:MAG: photosystem II protein Psb27 [Cyanobacteria bacterium]|jgi:photosystem II Psb27 protein|nr:photosystem II protein Psb27 [Cyanobacteriota bacterium]